MYLMLKSRHGCASHNKNIGHRTFIRSPNHKGRWRGLDEDVSDDQQDITRGRDMVDSLYQGFQGVGGTHNAILNSTDYLSSSKRSFSNVEDGFYISPSFLDKMTV